MLKIQIKNPLTVKIKDMIRFEGTRTIVIFGDGYNRS